MGAGAGVCVGDGLVGEDGKLCDRASARLDDYSWMVKEHPHEGSPLARKPGDIEGTTRHREGNASPTCVNCWEATCRRDES